MLILASNSPRRRQILAAAGWEFTTCSPNVDETVLAGETPDAYVVRLARSKAGVVAAQARSADVIVAADTAVVSPAGEILGKPSDPVGAAEMLANLRGRVHRVYTGLAVQRPNPNGLLLTDVDVTAVRMRDYTPAEVETYIASGDPLDKAGAYAVQHAGFHPVEWLDGCFANVMGLPVCKLFPLLARAGLESTDSAALLGCQTGTRARPCALYRQAIGTVP
jgi:MAF protein